MSSRLTRMLLINAKTSGIHPSGTITEIDPRDGAAITGENGVGKTTTLQLFPLFFGCSPSRIVSAGGSMQAMLRFVLPTPESAIVFEYQRGSPEDVCFVTIRRQEGLDAPEYRFFQGPFRSELFVYALPDGSGQAFYNDAGTIAAADRLGIARVRKLDGSQYRAVILRIRTQARDQSELRRLAQHYSFARRSLQHLDRLVANVVKEQVDFKDFITLALSMIYETMGGVGGVHASGPQPIRLRQTQDQIQIWLNNRDAGERALKLKPQLEQLTNTINQSRENRQQLIQLKQELVYCVARLHKSQEQITQALDDAAIERAEEEKSEQKQLLTLTDQQEVLGNKTQAQQDTLSSLQAQARHYHKESAEHWAERMPELETLRLQRQQNTEQLDLIEEKARHITAKIDQRSADIRTEEAQQIALLESQKAQPHHDYEQAEAQALARYEELLEEQGAAQEEQLAIQDNKIAQAHQQVGLCRSAVERPVLAEHYQDDLDASTNSLSLAQTSLAHAINAQADALAQRNQTSHQHQQAERQLTEAKSTLHKAEQKVLLAQQALHPEDGTLLASLRQTPPNEWRQHLARVLDPALLLRTDLAPKPPSELLNEHSLYGWDLNTEAIAAPSWSDDQALHEELTQCLEHRDAAFKRVQECAQALEQAAMHWQSKQEAWTEKEAERQIAERRTEQLKSELAVRQQQRDQARLHAKKQAQLALQDAEQSLRQAQQERQQLLQQQQEHGRQLKADYAELILAHKNRRDTALAALTKQVQAIKAQTQQLLNGLQQERDRRLAEAQIDPVAVNTLQQRIASLKHEIQSIESKQLMVEEWQKWVQADGPAKLAALQTEVAGLEQQKIQLQARIKQHEKESQDQARAYVKQRQEKLNQQQQIESEQNQAVQLLHELTELPAPVVIPLEEGWELTQIKGQLNTKRLQATELQRQLQHSKDRIYNELTNKDSDVKELVMQHMQTHTGTSSSVIEQAQELQNVYRNLGHLVIASINSSLGPLLENIGEFRKTIARFESHVHEFNKDLQVGLSQVSLRTERLRDLEIHIVCDFEKLDYLKKLDQLHSITVEHRLRVSETIVDSVPPASTAEALRDVLALLSNNSLEINLAQHITLKGSANDGGNIKPFNRESELQKLSSTGITAIALITLLSGMLNVVRREEKIYIPWVTDEVGRFDAKNFKSLMASLRDNHIDVVTASPALTPAMYPHFSNRYIFRPGSRVSVFQAATAAVSHSDIPSNAMTTVGTQAS